MFEVAQSGAITLGVAHRGRCGRSFTECGTVAGMIIGRGNRSTRRKRIAAPLCPVQTPRDLTWVRTVSSVPTSKFRFLQIPHLVNHSMLYKEGGSVLPNMEPHVIIIRSSEAASRRRLHGAGAADFLHLIYL
jgi:hypothetical protein